jgi:hypothetical protein
VKPLIDIIDTEDTENIIDEIMGHRQDMTSQQRLKWDTENYKKRLESKKGSNYEYWSDKHEKMLQNGWDLFLITGTSTRQWSETFKRYSTSSEDHAKKFVDELRNNNNYARIVCGYNKNKQRVKMYSIIFKPKK